MKSSSSSSSSSSEHCSSRRLVGSAAVMLAAATALQTTATPCWGFQQQQSHLLLQRTFKQGSSLDNLQTATLLNRPSPSSPTTSPKTSLMKAMESPNGDVEASASLSPTKQALDYSAVGRYVVAFAVQMSLIKAVLTGIDLTIIKGLGIKKVPFIVNFIFFYFFALKSRVFNPMSNKRPKPATKEIEVETATKDETVEAAPRKMPKWTPPGVVFPIVWLLIIGPLRAISSSLVVSKLLEMGSATIYGSTTILFLMGHLSIGDIWNTINNTERRYGTSVLGVALVWISAALAASKYNDVVPLAGKLLSIPLVWLSIASSLIFRTWQLNNPNPVTGRPYSILPRLEQGKAQTITKLIWFEK